MAAWKKSPTEQLELWERRMFWIAPIRGDLRKLRELLYLIEGNGAVVQIMDETLVDALVRMERAIAADSEYWRWLLAQARARGEGGKDGSD